MSETPEGMAEWLISLAGDLRSGKLSETAIDALEDVVEEWRAEFPEN